jgi:hypothetical protein
MAALLRLIAMLVSHAASLLRMRPGRLSGECHADATPQTLPSATSGHSGKAEPAEATSQTTEALMVSSERSSRRVYPELVEGSNHEGVLTAASCKPIETPQHGLDLPPLIPAKAGTQGGLQGLSCLQAAAALQNKPRLGFWMPTFVGTSGVTAPT